MGRSKPRKATQEIDDYLDSIQYEDIVLERIEKIYNNIFCAVAKIVINFYPDIDLTEKIELAVSTSTVSGAASITATGYVKISDTKYIPIEKTYLPERVLL